MAERHQLLDGGTRGARRKHRGVQLRVEAQLPRGARQRRAHILHSPQRQPQAHSAEAQRTQGPFHAARATTNQFAILEPLAPEENGVEISIEGSVDEMVDRAIKALNAYAATVAAQTATQAA